VQVERCGNGSTYVASSTSLTGDTFALRAATQGAGNCLTLDAGWWGEWVSNIGCATGQTDLWRLVPAGTTHWLVQHVASGRCLNREVGGEFGPRAYLTSCTATGDAPWSVEKI
jgi:hypothetical protein